MKSLRLYLLLFPFVLPATSIAGAPAKPKPAAAKPKPVVAAKPVAPPDQPRGFFVYELPKTLIGGNDVVVTAAKAVFPDQNPYSVVFTTFDKRHILVSYDATLAPANLQATVTALLDKIAIEPNIA